MNTMHTHLNAGLAGAGAGNVPLGSNASNTPRASNTMHREGDRPKLYPQSGRAKPAAAKHSTARPASGAPTSGTSANGKRPTNTPEHGDSSGSQPSYRPPSGNSGGNGGGNSFVQGVMAFVQEHRRELITGGMLLAAVLLLLSLVSYDPLDYANGKVSLSQSSAEELAVPPRSRVGVPSTTLNAEPHPYVVQNWLGFAGACAAQFVYHYTVGYAGLIFPALLTLWAVAYYKRSMSEKLMLGTGLALVGASLVASIVGVMQLVAWMPDFVVRPEWSGSVGQFIARMLWQLIGTIGALFVLAVAAAATVFAALDLDVEKTLARAKREKTRLQAMKDSYRAGVSVKATVDEEQWAGHGEQGTVSSERRTEQRAQSAEPPMVNSAMVNHAEHAEYAERAERAEQPSHHAAPMFDDEPARFVHTAADKRDMGSVRRDLLSKYGDAFNEPLVEPSGASSGADHAFSRQPEPRTNAHAYAPPHHSTVDHGTMNREREVDAVFARVDEPVASIASEENLKPNHESNNGASNDVSNGAARVPVVNISAPHTAIDAPPFVYPTNASVKYVQAASNGAVASSDASDALPAPASDHQRFFDEAGTAANALHVARVQHVEHAANGMDATLPQNTMPQSTAFTPVAHVSQETVEQLRTIAVESATEAALEVVKSVASHVAHQVVNQMANQVASQMASEFVAHAATLTVQREAVSKAAEAVLNAPELDVPAFQLPDSITATLAKADALNAETQDPMGFPSGRAMFLDADDEMFTAANFSPNASTPNVSNNPPNAAQNLVKESLAKETVAAAPAAPEPTIHIVKGRQQDVFKEASKQEAADVNAALDEHLAYVPPTLDLLVPQEDADEVNEAELRENGRLLTEKLRTFRIEIEDLNITPGPVVTQYEFVPAAGIKVSQIEGLADDIALALKARGIRIIAPVPGRGTVAVEIPNHKATMVRFESIVDSDEFRDNSQRLPLALGKTISGDVFCADLAKMPHLLIAGSTGSGKSVGINTIIASLLYKMHPRQLKFLIVDPKKIEMTQYKPLLKHFLAVCPDIDETIITNSQNAVVALKSVEAEMERRYDVLAKVGQRNIADYNAKVAEGKYKDTSDFVHREMPYIVVIVDELADLMMTAGRDVEDPIIRLAQLARAVGIHLIVATQRPSVDVVTGLIKANFPARIAFQVASKVDSRTILDMSGAEHLLGNGDMLFLVGGAAKPVRVQNSFLSTEEVERVCEHISAQGGYSQPYMLPSVSGKAGKGGAVSDVDDRDDMFEEAARLVVRHQQGSVSLLQRRLKIGYSRAARIMDQLEEAGIVGPFDGSKGRIILFESEADLDGIV